MPNWRLQRLATSVAVPASPQYQVRPWQRTASPKYRKSPAAERHPDHAGFTKADVESGTVAVALFSAGTEQIVNNEGGAVQQLHAGLPEDWHKF